MAATCAGGVAIGTLEAISEIRKNWWDAIKGHDQILNEKQRA